jgi:hypothetical protein
MDFSEFLRRVGAEPRSKATDLLEARAGNPAFERAATDAEAFEQRLEAALGVPADGEALLREALQQAGREPGSRPRWPWLAMAASILVVVGVLSIGISRQSAVAPGGSVEHYVREHFSHDGQQVLAMASPDFNPAQLEQVLAQLSVRSSAALASQVRYVKFCPTPDGKGAHMVVQSDSGLVTVIVMPQTQVKNSMLVAFDGVEATVFPLEAGSAAIIGSPGQQHAALKTLLQESILPRAS